MISVPIDRIVPLTDARDNFSRLVADVEGLSEGLYVLTKGGKPAIALINIQYLEEIMSGKVGRTTAPAVSKSAPAIQPKAPVNPPTESLPAETKVEPKMPEANKFEPPITSASTPMTTPSKPTPTNYDVKPTPATPSYPPPPVKPKVNPTWIGEEVKPNIPSSAPATAPVNAPPATSPVASKSPVNPWPILPPRAPANPTNASGVTAPSGSLPVSTGSRDAAAQPPASPVGQTTNAPTMTPPKPATAPTSTPVSYQTVPVPVNGGTTPQAAPRLENLPPPPTTNNTAPFSENATAPSITPKRVEPTTFKPDESPVVKPNASSIPFDEPPKTIVEPGEPMPAETKTPTESVATPANTDTAQQTSPPQGQASVQDLEI